MTDNLTCDCCGIKGYWVAYSRADAGNRCINCLGNPEPNPLTQK